MLFRRSPPFPREMSRRNWLKYPLQKQKPFSPFSGKGEKGSFSQCAKPAGDPAGCEHASKIVIRTCRHRHLCVHIRDEILLNNQVLSIANCMGHCVISVKTWIMPG
ncbi:hypothetical protein Gmet_3638 [Geobacter metallireducens GS-15]|uniref:Uncharacterized protein n=1 Tax=Geobacter metallireducens (strain ATCC 53774 / DSM 7210 / GS-15) TaxID=269799 RepID=J7LYI8_GEOMG|nr:hypothetical protein Gmet_3638 [Geobacter metallireducens GS-15]